MAIFGILNLIKLLIFIAAIVLLTVGLIKMARKNKERRQEAIHQLLNGQNQENQNPMNYNNTNSNNNMQQ